MSAEQVSIWQPVGKQPSGLWAGESSNLNDVFNKLYEHFKTHSEYGFEYMGSNYNDEILRHYSSMQLARIVKWLAYYGLVQHHAERMAHTDPHDENKKVLVHNVKPTAKGYELIAKGEVFDIGQSHSDAHKIGLGKGYPSFDKSQKWLNDAYACSKVAQWRQAKWCGEFNRFYYDHLEKSDIEMQKLLSAWMMEHLATIPTRHNRRIKNVAPLEQAICKPLTDWLKI